MRRVLSWSIVALMGILVVAESARAETRDDLCVAPKEMKTNKWQPRTEVGGMTLLIPPGFGAQGMGSGDETSGAHYYVNGEHRSIMVGFGAGVQSIMRDPGVTEKSECDTQIAGRRVNITVYNWVVEDALFSSSGHAGPHFAAVARFYPSGSQREVYVALVSNVMYELKSFKQLFWTVAFDGPQTVAGASPPAAPPAAATVATTASPNATSPAGPTCMATASLPPNAPAASAVIDSAVVQSLLASAAPIPAGYEIMQLQFDANNELAGMAVSQSDLPEASQRELAAVVGTNLKPHDNKEPSSIYLRIDAANSGLHYSVVSPSTCKQ